MAIFRRLSVERRQKSVTNKLESTWKESVVSNWGINPASARRNWKKQETFNWKATFNNKYQNYLIFYLKLGQYFYSKCSQFNNSILFIYKVTIHNMLNMFSIWMNESLITSNQGLFHPVKDPGWLRMVRQALTMR